MGDVLNIGISGICVNANNFPPITTNCNRNRYKFYLAEVNGRDEKKNEVRTYLKMYGSEYEAADFKVGKIYHACEWDSYKKRRADSYYVVLSNDLEASIEAIKCSTYLKALNTTRLIEKEMAMRESDTDNS